jgi:hypothetical protein
MEGGFYSVPTREDKKRKPSSQLKALSSATYFWVDVTYGPPEDVEDGRGVCNH